MWPILRWISIAAGALSALALIKQGLAFGFAAPLQTILDYYNATLHLALGWTEEPLRVFLQALRRLFSWDLQLHSEWKHLFVMSMVIWGAFPRAFLGSARTRGDYLVACLGFAFVIALSLVLGILPSTDGKPAFGRAGPGIVFLTLAGLIVVFFGVITLLSNDPRNWRSTFLQSPGGLILQTLVAIALFLITNAGLKLAGL